MIGLAFAAILGFKFGSSTQTGSLVIGGAMGSAASTIAFILGNDVLQNYPRLIPAIF